MFDERFVKTDTDQVIPISPGNPYSRLQIHATVKDAFRALKGSMTREELSNAQGFVDLRDGNTAHVIAENIKDGDVGGVILHEVGVHLGLEGMMDDAEVSVLADAVDQWATMPKDSNERKIYDLVTARIAAARMLGMDESHLNSEKIAYAVEEAARLGVRPDEDSMHKASVWLGNVQKFLTRIITRLTGTTPDVALSAKELVSVAYGAAKGVMREGVVEKGAVTNSDDILMQYYAGNDRTGRQGELPDNAKIAPNLYPLMGGEVFEWGKGSKISDKKNISTEASFFQGGMNMMVYAAKDFDPFIEIRLDQIETGDVYIPHVYALTVYGGMESTNSTDVKDVDGDTWSRMEGVSRRELIRLLAEARRRLTRHNRGAIPNIIFDRVTGAAVANKTGIRRGTADYQTLYKKFSMKRREPGVSIDRTPGREAVRKVFGKAGYGDSAVEAYDTIAGFASKPIANLQFLYDFIESVEGRMPSARKVYDALKKSEAAVNEMAKETQEIAARAQRLAPERLAAVNDFLGKSTFYQKWGYDPKQFHEDLFANKKVKVDPVLEPAFNRLAADEQQIVADIFAQGESRRQRKEAFIKSLGIKGDFFSSSKLVGPYAPLKRFGSYVAVLKSQAVLDAETALDANKNAANAKKLEALKSDGSQYVVQFFDTKGNANRFAEKNADKYARTEAFKRDEKFDSGRAPSTDMLESLLGRLKADNKSGMDGDAKKAFADMIREHYFEALDERDARTSGARRLNRAGFEQDMVRSFVFHATAEARLISTMENGAAVNEAMAQAREESRADSGELNDTYNLLSEHYGQMLTRKDGWIDAVQDRVAGFNTFMMLTTNYGYHVQNATQVLIAVNKLYGDFGSYNKSWGEMFKAYKVANKAIKGGFFNQVAAVGTIGLYGDNDVEIDNTDASMPQEYQALVRELDLQQLADVGLQEDLNQMNRLDTGSDALNNATDKVSRVVHRLYQVARYVEAHNRLSTAIAAFEMAKKNPAVLRTLKVDTPLQYAVTAVQRTQGAFNGLDAPLAIKKLPKLMTQFRKYQIMMGFNYGRAAQQILQKESPEIRTIGMRTLGVTLTHAAITAGTVGLPFLAPIAYVASMALNALEGDDEEIEANKAKAAGGYDRWLEQSIQESVEDKDLANLLTRGVPAFLGLDMSGKIGHQNIFAFQPYSDLNFTRDGLPLYAADIVFGPSSSQLRNFGGSMQAFKRGDEMKGFELLLPKGARQYLESYRYATEGMTVTNGDVMLDPRSIDLTSLMKNAMGLPDTDIQMLKWTRGQQYELKQYFSERSSQLQREYGKAFKDRDSAEMKSLRLEWRELQKAKDRVRPFFNSRNELKRQPVTDLMSVGRRRRKSERRLQERLGTN